MSVGFRAGGAGVQGSFFGNGSPLNNNNLTVPSTISNGVVIAFVYMDNGTAAITGDTAKWGGTALTRVTRFNWGTTNAQVMDIWALLTGSGSTGNLTLALDNTVSGGVTTMALGAACFDGVTQSSIAAAFTGAATHLVSVATTAFSVGPVTTAGANAVLGYFVTPDTDLTGPGGSTAGQTSIYSDNNLVSSGAEYALISSGTSQTMTWTAGTAGTYKALGINIVSVAGFDMTSRGMMALP